MYIFLMLYKDGFLPVDWIDRAWVKIPLRALIYTLFQVIVLWVICISSTFLFESSYSAVFEIVSMTGSKQHTNSHLPLEHILYKMTSYSAFELI